MLTLPNSSTFRRVLAFPTKNSTKPVKLFSKSLCSFSKQVTPQLVKQAYLQAIQESDFPIHDLVFVATPNEVVGFGPSMNGEMGFIAQFPKGFESIARDESDRVRLSQSIVEFFSSVRDDDYDIDIIANNSRFKRLLHSSLQAYCRDRQGNFFSTRSALVHQADVQWGATSVEVFRLEEACAVPSTPTLVVLNGVAPELITRGNYDRKLFSARVLAQSS